MVWTSPDDTSMGNWGSHSLISVLYSSSADSTWTDLQIMDRIETFLNDSMVLPCSSLSFILTLLNVMQLDVAVMFWWLSLWYSSHCRWGSHSFGCGYLQTSGFLRWSVDWLDFGVNTSTAHRSMSIKVKSISWNMCPRWNCRNLTTTMTPKSA